jgi:hypothetical protein
VGTRGKRKKERQECKSQEWGKINGARERAREMMVEEKQTPLGWKIQYLSIPYNTANMELTHLL